MHRSVALIASMLIAAALAGCGSDGSDAVPWTSESLDVTDAEILSTEVLPQFTSISPSGKLGAFLRIDEFCVETIVPDDGDDDVSMCFDVEADDRPDPESLNWSSDESQLVFAGPSISTGRDPDIWVLDIADDADLEVLTDDGVDQPGDGDLDIAPFFGPGDAVYFFRLNFDSGYYNLYRIDDDRASPIDDVRLPESVVPDIKTRQLSDTSAVIFWTEIGGPAGLSVIDLDENTIQNTELDEDTRGLVAAAGRYAIVGDLSARGLNTEPFQLVDLETGRSRQVEADLDPEREQMVAIAVTPSGDAIVAQIYDFAGDHRFVVMPVSDGRIDDPVELFDLRDLDDFRDFEDTEEFEGRVLSGIGRARVELIATPSGHLILAAREDLAVITLGEE